MGPITNIFGLVVGFNLLLVGSVAFVAGMVSLLKKNPSVKRPTAVVFVIAGAVAVYFGIMLSRSAFN